MHRQHHTKSAQQYPSSDIGSQSPIEQVRLLQRENTVLLEQLDRTVRERDQRIFELEGQLAQETRSLEGQLRAEKLRADDSEQQALALKAEVSTLKAEKLEGEVTSSQLRLDHDSLRQQARRLEVGLDEFG